jgi:hypothetical protein
MMSATLEHLTKADAYRAYRAAFEDFSTKVQRVQCLIAEARPDDDAISAALAELEKARATYNTCRSAMVQLLMPVAGPDLEHPQVQEAHVRAIAELLWADAGKPDGGAERDWRKAEEIVRYAAVG